MDQHSVDFLTTAASLARDLAAQRPPSLLDVRWRLAGPPAIEDYRAGRLPGAAFVDLDRDLAAPPGPGGRHPIPAAGDFQAAMRRAGVRAGWPVVVYDEADGSMAAARAWWLLRYFGHRQVTLLDGGYRAWVVAGGEVAVGDPPPVSPGDFTASPGHMPVLDADGAAALAHGGALLDARAAGRYRGEVEPVDPVAGHIPGAVSAPAADNVDSCGQFLAAPHLRARFAGLGAVPGLPVGVYCGSGVVAAQEVLALAVVGIQAALYVGSWSDWIGDPARPVATGPAPG